MRASMARCLPLRRRLLLVLAACTALLLAISLSASAGREAGVGCKPGPTKVDGKKATRFCGTATAALHAADRWFRLRGGACASTSKFFTINIGTAVVAPNQKVPYFGLTVGSYPGAPTGSKAAGRDGVYRKGVVVIRWHGGAWDVNGWVRITLWKHLTAGTFSGATTFSPHRKISGSFSC
jgi:hypothetical protein